MANTAPATPLLPTTDQAIRQSYLVPMIIITTLFFIFGFVTNINDVLIPHLKRACQLTDFQSAFVQSAFFGAYFLMSLPAGAILKRIGYKNGIILGLLICAAGAFLFIPAANTRVYLFFLFALSVLASGITLLQVAANPYVSILGKPEGAASRLSLTGTANSLAGTLSPRIFGGLLLGGVAYTAGQVTALPEAQREAYLNAEAALVKTPYLILGLVLAGLALMVGFTKMPALEGVSDDNSTQTSQNKTSILRYRHLVLGVVAIFMYVGAEVSVGSFLIRYGQSLGIAGFSELSGSQFVSYYWGSALVGRFIGIFVMDKINFAKALVVNSAAALLLVTASVLTGTGTWALWTIVLVGLCNSIMWPVIFPMAIKGLGQHTKQGSSLLIMAVVGGALVPLLVGYVSDQAGIRWAYLVLLPCYLYLLYYGLDGHRFKVSSPNTSISGV